MTTKNASELREEVDREVFSSQAGSAKFTGLWLTPTVFLVLFENAVAMNCAIMRVHNALDVPATRGLFLSWAELEGFHALHGRSFLDQFDRYAGWHFTKSEIGRFLHDHRLLPLGPSEAALIDVLRHVPDSSSVILVSRELASSYLRHEMAHALWEQCPSYREASKSIIRGLPYLQATKELLYSWDYTEEHLENELQAFAVAGSFLHGLEMHGGEAHRTVAEREAYHDQAREVYTLLSALMEAELGDNYAHFRQVDWDIALRRRTVTA